MHYGWIKDLKTQALVLFIVEAAGIEKEMNLKIINKEKKCERGNR